MSGWLTIWSPTGVALLAGLRQHMQTSPLTDEPGFGRKAEQACQLIVEAWPGREAPDVGRTIGTSS